LGQGPFGESSVLGYRGGFAAWGGALLGKYISAVIVVLGVVVIATWIKYSVNSRTIMFGLVVGLMGFFGFLAVSLSKGSIDIKVVVVTLLATLIGLGIGAVVSVFRR